MGPASPPVAPAGFFLSLLTESFAVRALLGSVVAAALAAVALRRVWVRRPLTRRLVVLAPILAAAVAGVASVVEAESYLPQLWVTTANGASGQVLELLGELRVISSDRGVDVLVTAWAVAVLVLLSRRVWGVVATRRLLRLASPVPTAHELQRVVDGMAMAMGTRHVRLHLLADCPGGALTTGVRRPVVVLDPVLIQTLDAQELEGLLAHEIAHVARRDTLLGVVVGVFADLTFFLPTVHLATRWLNAEREESADELAAVHTRRPGALASSILKVWEGAVPRTQPLAACGAVAVATGARVVTGRVERLVSAPPVRSRGGRALESWVTAVVLVAALVGAVVVPPWIASELDTYSIAIGYVPPPADPVESAAFATFRALAPAPVAGGGLEGYPPSTRPSMAPASGNLSVGCPCVETQAQWLAGAPATVPKAPEGMAWQRSPMPAWASVAARDAVRARPLLTLTDAGPQVGFFVVAQEGR
ncbi:MAG TPA: M56 family metallopeptidase [Egibacteraceae bacterium]|nr:M56 family metallopeptidase [Egibacteraceae bacterium]